MKLDHRSNNLLVSSSYFNGSCFSGFQKLLEGIVVIVSQCIFSIMYYHFPNFVIIHGVSTFTDYHSINEIRAFTQFFVFLILFSLQRLHLLLIITFKAKILNNKIDFSKLKKMFTIYFYFEICDETMTIKMVIPGMDKLRLFWEVLFPSGRST